MQPEEVADFSADSQRASAEENLVDHLISLVFWYKDNNPAPIYTLDARQALVTASQTAPNRSAGSLEAQIFELNRRLIGQAKHYEGTSAGSGAGPVGAGEEWARRARRTSVRVVLGGGDWAGERGREASNGETPSFSIGLRLDGLQASDSGDYKCRVDFRRARTIRQTVRLFVEGKQFSANAKLWPITIDKLCN